MTKALGGQVGDMVLWPLGGFVICGPVESVSGDFNVAIAGPLMHLPQMGFWAGLYAAFTGGDFSDFSIYADTSANFGAMVSEQAFFLNFYLFLFNLFVPAYPMDGGRCLAAGLILCGMSVICAAMTTAGIGMLTAAAIAVWGIVRFILGSPNGLFTAFIGAWIFITSYRLFKLTRRSEEGASEGNAANNLRSHPIFGQRCYQERAA
mmetsp:Transcript_10672/g.15700  ORF Transcript_10672/g.15700 Transcript_10672/m.15700 type:complete len:206 (+) Transcript_10672:533-1150(+)